MWFDEEHGLVGFFIHGGSLPWALWEVPQCTRAAIHLPIVVPFDQPGFIAPAKDVAGQLVPMVKPNRVGAYMTCYRNRNSATSIHPPTAGACRLACAGPLTRAI